MGNETKSALSFFGGIICLFLLLVFIVYVAEIHAKNNAEEKCSYLKQENGCSYELCIYKAHHTEENRDNFNFCIEKRLIEVLNNGIQ